MRHSVRNKIWCSIAILVAGYCFSTFFGFVRGSQNESRLMSVAETLYPAANESKTAFHAFNNQVKLYGDAVLTGEESTLDQATERYNEGKAALKAILALPNMEQEHVADIQAVLTALDAFSAKAGAVYRKMALGGGEDKDSEKPAQGPSIEEQVAQLAQETQSIQTQLNDQTRRFAQHLNEKLTSVCDSTRQQRYANLILFFAVLVVAGVVVYVIVARTIGKPLLDTVAMFKDIAQGEGDLTRRLKVNSKDEIGELAHWFNMFLDKLQAIIRQIAATATTLESSSSNLLGTASRMAGGTTQMATQSSSVTAAAQEMAANLNQMTTSSEQMSGSVKTVAEAVEALTRTITEVARNAENAANVANEASSLAQASDSQMAQLGEAAQTIGKVIEVIQDIAEQTNLLALNATIEAARAGESGKGFAVVATEVKELARQTTKAAEDISSRINGIQSSVIDSVAAISQIRQVIQKVNEVSRTIALAVEEQSITTSEISSNIAQTAFASEQVSSGINSSSASSQEITRTITGVDNNVKEAARGAAQTQVAGEELSCLAVELQGLVKQFKV